MNSVKNNIKNINYSINIKFTNNEKNRKYTWSTCQSFQMPCANIQQFSIVLMISLFEDFNENKRESVFLNWRLKSWEYYSTSH